MKNPLGWFWLVLALASVGLSTGCATTESDNKADRPWNAPMNWEYGLPPSMMEGR
jgi:hypothetical protein